MCFVRTQQLRCYESFWMPCAPAVFRPACQRYSATVIDINIEHTHYVQHLLHALRRLCADPQPVFYAVHAPAHLLGSLAERRTGVPHAEHLDRFGITPQARRDGVEPVGLVVPVTVQREAEADDHRASCRRAVELPARKPRKVSREVTESVPVTHTRLDRARLQSGTRRGPQPQGQWLHRFSLWVCSQTLWEEYD